jgi:phosphomannomutase/phosphoglucomutase
MAFSHHELSVENAVIPFSLSLPSHSQAGPTTFEMEFPQMSTPAQIAPKFPDSIFRAYDIRGTVPEFLNAETAYWIGRAIGAQSLAQGEPNVSVGRDGRLSGPELVEN